MSAYIQQVGPQFMPVQVALANPDQNIRGLLSVLRFGFKKWFTPAVAKPRSAYEISASVKQNEKQYETHSRGYYIAPTF